MIENLFFSSHAGYVQIFAQSLSGGPLGQLLNFSEPHFFSSVSASNGNNNGSFHKDAVSLNYIIHVK